MPLSQTKSLTDAKLRDDNEFYTRYEDIAIEMERCRNAKPDFFSGKTVYCPSDDPDRSMFVKFFDENFEKFGIRKLIATSLVPNGKGHCYERTESGSERKRLDSDGDFQVDEVQKFWDEADVIATNPAFSLFKNFMEKCEKKDIVILGPQHAAFYIKIFPRFRDREIFADYPLKPLRFVRPDGSEKPFGNVWWFTTLDTGGRKPMELRTMKENLENNKFFRTKLMKTYGEIKYEEYLNFDGIDVPSISAIPSDYDGIMGVPAGILASYDKDQFEIVGYSQANDKGNPVPIRPIGEDFLEKLYAQGKTGHYSKNMRILTVITDNGKAVIPFGRVLIRQKKRG